MASLLRISAAPRWVFALCFALAALAPVMTAAGSTGSSSSIAAVALGRRSLLGGGRPALTNSTPEQDYVPGLREWGYDFLPGALPLLCCATLFARSPHSSIRSCCG